MAAFLLVTATLVGVMMPSGHNPPVPNSASSHGPSTVPPEMLARFDRGTRASQADWGEPATSAGNGETAIDRAPDGHFYTDAEVNGIPVHFLIDTGSSGVALTRGDAQRVGLSFSPSEFQVIGSGASGAVRGQIVTLGRVSLHGRSATGVGGAILDGGETSLLGQSFLSQLGSVEIHGDRMTLR